MNSAYRPFPSSGHNPRSVVTATFDRRTKAAKKRFIQWLNKNHPDLLNRAIRDADVPRDQLGLNGFGQGDDRPWYDRILDATEKLVPIWAGIEQQKELIKINERRAKQGLDPINQAQFEVEAGEATRKEIGQSVKAGLGQYKIPIYIGLGLLAAKAFKVI